MEKIYLQANIKRDKAIEELKTAKEQLINSFIEAFQKMDIDDIVKEEERANCITLTINCKFQ